MEEKIVQSLKKMLPIPKIEERHNVLCILPHPDDGEIGAGGTIAKLKASGSKVTYLMVTEGGAGIKGKSREETVNIRKKEQEDAARLLGVDKIIWLNYPDGGRYDINDVRENIKKHIENIDPDLILTVDPFLPYET
ncbi:MAG: PIG-L family deacetylase, partial [Defluviitoga tunisiensis]